MNESIVIACAAISPFLLCGALFVFSLCRVSAMPTPKPVPTKEQLIWMTAAARVAHRRAS